MAIWIKTGCFISSVGILYMDRKMVLIMSHPIAPVSNRTLASHPVICILPSRAILGLIPSDCILCVLTCSTSGVGVSVLLIHTSVVSVSEVSHSARLTTVFLEDCFPFLIFLL